MSPRKKAARRKGRAARAKPRRWLGWAWRASALLVGLAIGLGVPWVLWLDHQVRTEFEGRRWDLPSRVYARPLTLYEGLALTPAALDAELAAAGYRREGGEARPGRYSTANGRYRIHRRAFRFEDGAEPALRLDVVLGSGRVASLRDGDTGEALGIARLDAAEIASIWPLHEEDRTLVAVEAVPPLLVTGVQAVEDRRFKHHHGVDLRGIGRALVANLRAGEAVQGGSTLTQQLVKNYFLDSRRTLLRKANEAVMALSLEWRYDKADILEAYLNEVFLGQQGNHAIHGFGRASEFYFGEPLDALGAHQVALLVGLARGASYYNPRRNPERARARRDRVLDIFGETGLLDAKQVAAAKARPLDVTPEASVGRGRAPAFVDLVRRQLKRDYDADDLASEGLRIFTTLAPSEQALAERAVSEGLADLAARGLPDDLQGALVLAEVESGEVRALVGDRVPARHGFNRALDARRQVGSVIKPLVYLLALEHADDYNLITPVEDEPITLRQPDGRTWQPENYDGVSHGEVPLIDALVHSYNQATVRLGMRIGVAHLVAKLAQLGVEQEVPALPSTLLGAVELTPLEVTQIYQSIAAGGYSVPLRAVTAVQTPEGELLNRYPLRLLPLERRDAVAVLSYALTEVVTRGTARELPRLLRSQVAVAGKTGTTNERRDSWFVGYTRDRVAAAWVGLDDNRPASVTGSNAAMRVWARLFRELPLEAPDLRMPDGAYWMAVDRRQRALSHPSCPGATEMPFVAGSEPRRVSDCLRDVERDQKKPIWEKWFGRDN